VSVDQLLERVAAEGVVLFVEDGCLRFAAPAARLSDELRAEVQAQRARVIEALGHSEHMPGVVARMPLSFLQRSLWYLDRCAQGRRANLMSGCFRLHGHFDPERFEAALQHLAQRHPLCRAAVIERDGLPTLAIAGSCVVPFERADAAGLPSDGADALVRQVMDRTVDRPFDLAAEPLLRAAAVRRAPNEWWLAFAIHHLIADEWSVGILLRELSTLYSDGTGQSLPRPRTDALMQSVCALDGTRASTELDHWRRCLRPPLPILDLPTSGVRPAHRDMTGSRVRQRLAVGITHAADVLARDSQATAFMVYLTAFLVVLARQSGQDDIVVGTVVANRDRPGADAHVGCFINTIALRCDLSGNPSFRTLLNRVREVALAAYAHAQTPFDLVVKNLAIKPDAARPPVFQAAIVLENAPTGALTLADVVVETIESDPRTAKFDLTLVIAERANGTYAMLDYADTLFTANAMQRMLAQFATVLEHALAAPDERCACLPILADDERRRIESFEAGPPAAVPGPARLDALFAAQVRQTPVNAALAMNNAVVTYQELDAWADQLASRLIAQGVRPGAIVGLCIARSFDMVVAVLAVLKAGGAYLPLDPAYPVERLRAMTAQTALAALLVHDATASLSDGLVEAISPGRVISVPPREEAASLPPVRLPTQPADSNDLACVIYTSGSTAEPKGVLVSHSGLCNLALAQIDAFGITATSRVLQFASLNFDASASELFTALLSGATLCLADTHQLLANLGGLLFDQRISVATLPPAVLKLLDHQSLPNLATLVVAGDVCPPELARRWAVGRRFLNAYGPTETSVCATIATLGAESSVLPIGRPIAGMAVRILDARGQRVPIGVAGDLYISGVGVSLGYSGMPDLTAERFTTDPHATLQSARRYDSGDRARWREDGQIDFLGRRDRQIKLRGMRVEPAEIEAALRCHPAVKDAVVVARATDEGEPYLAAYVVLQASRIAGPSEEVLKTWLRRDLPSHLVPSVVISVDALPLGPNGKIDHRALSAPDSSRLGSAQTKVPPRDDTEERLLSIWRTVLPEAGDLGVTDDFFAAGGHSLLMVRLLAAVERTFGRRLPFSALTTGPTVEALARHLRERDAAAPWSPLITLRAARAGVPLFCVHPLGGNVIGYLPLVRHLQAGHAIYGLQAPGVDAGTTACASIAGLASIHLAAVLAVQPKPPYRLAGHSFGGLIAFEMACQIRRRGIPVELLVVLDTPAPIPANRPAPINSDGEWLLRRIGALERFSGAKLRVSSTRFLALPPPEQIEVFLRAMRDAGLLAADAGEQLVHRVLAVQRASHQAMLDYRPGRFDGAVHVIRATDRTGDAGSAEDARAFVDPQLDWPELTDGQVVVATAPGDHITMLTEPHVAATAAILAGWVDALQPPQASRARPRSMRARSMG